MHGRIVNDYFALYVRQYRLSRQKHLQFSDNFLRQAGEFALPGDSGMDGIALDQQLGAFSLQVLPAYPVVEAAGQAFQFGERGLDGQQVIIEGGGLEAGLALGDRQDNALLFDFPVGADPFPHQFGAADLEVAEIVGVIDHAAGVGVAVQDAAGGAVDM